METARLLLRAHRADDFADGLRLWSDPEVVRFIGGRPATREEAWTRLLRYAGHWTLLGYGFWAVIHKASGRFIGEVGLADFHREMTPALDGTPEAGWAFAPRAHGQGFATEAVGAALAWGDEAMTHGATVCLIHPDNAASLGVARKCGFAAMEATSYRGEPSFLLRRARPAAA